MKKVLIHTLFYKNYNYGAMIQAYALYKTIEDKDYQCEELLYTQTVQGISARIKFRLFRVLEIFINPMKWLKEKKQKKSDLAARQEYIRIAGGDRIQIVFEKFMNVEFNTTSVYTPETIKNIPNIYDYYVVGGDQVWNPKWIDSNFFGKNLKNVYKIGYSCSAGADINFNKYYCNKIKKGISMMDIASVREKDFAKLLRRINVKSIVVPDPVFLFDKNEWIDFSENIYKLPDNYIFVYLLGKDICVRNSIIDYAHKHKQNIVFIPYVYRRYLQADEGFADIEIFDASPRNFVGLINKASLIITDSFHGTALSIILEKDFICINRHSGQDARLNSLIEDYGLQERFLMSKDVDKICKISDNIDYSNKKFITYDKCKDARGFINEFFD